MEIKNKILGKPKIIGIVGDRNSGKSNLIYHLLTELKKDFKFNLYTYGLRFDVGGTKINSIEELEKIRGSLIILDEFFSLFNLEDMKKRKLIEKTFRLLFHNNNIVILSGIPNNYKKFISSQLDIIIYQKCSLNEFINGSRAKYVCLSYRGDELGSSVLNLQPNEALIYEEHYEKIEIPFLKQYDSKAQNKNIFQKNPPKNPSFNSKKHSKKILK